MAEVYSTGVASGVWGWVPHYPSPPLYKMWRDFFIIVLLSSLTLSSHFIGYSSFPPFSCFYDSLFFWRKKMSKHTKLDYFSGVWSGLSLHEVADMYKLRGQLFSDYFEDGFNTQIGGEGWFCYICNGVKIFVPASDLELYRDKFSSPEFYDIHFPRIKIDFSGLGLDWYRELLSKPIEDIFRKPYAELHPTRGDFALDLINESADVFTALKDYLYSLDQKSVSHVCCAGLRGGVTYQLKSGEQQTIYIGKTSADFLLRIYNKKMEYCDESGNWKVPVSSLPYADELIAQDELHAKNPDIPASSWIRLELQCRRDAAAAILYHPIIGADGKIACDDHGCVISSDETLDVWSLANCRTMLHRYAFRDMSESVDHKVAVILPFWKVLLSEFDDNIPIIQISHFVQLVKAHDRAVRNVKKYSNSIIFYIAVYKISGLIALLDSILQEQQQARKRPTKDVSFGADLRHNALICMLQSYSSDSKAFVGLVRRNGIWSINQDEISLSA